MKTETDDPYKAAKFFFKSKEDFISFFTENEFTQLYQKIAASEPELNISNGNNPDHFYRSGLKINKMKLFESAMEAFGDSSHIHKLQFKYGHYSGHAKYLDELITSGRVTLKRHSKEDLVSCILPAENELKKWASPEAEIFYSFDIPNGYSQTSTKFSNNERKFFNNLVSDAAKDLIAPVREISLSKEDLDRVEQGSFGKNVFFLIKSEIKGNAVYPITESNQDRNQVAHKIIILPNDKSAVNHRYILLHQLAIGVADLQHPSYYGSTIDRANCDFGATISDTVMSHICPPGSFSQECFNVQRWQNSPDSFREKINFREADIEAITKSLVKQYPQLEQKMTEFENSRQTCEFQPQATSNQLMMAAFLVGAMAMYLVNRISKPSTSINKPKTEQNKKQNINSNER